MRQNSFSVLSLLLILTTKLARCDPTYNADCPASCLCIHDIQVLCEQSSMHELPSPLAPATEHLALRKTNISSIRPDAFRGLPRLRQLVLDSNQICDIAAHAFRGLSNMEELSVQDNPLTYLATYSFSGLVNITNLFLGYNKIAIIASDAFANTHHIRALSLTGNPLKTISSGAFSNLYGVDILYLPAGIEEIEPDTFNGLSNVSMLRLAGLQLGQLQQYAFRGLTNVSSLNIRDSRITTIKSRAFYGLSSVDYLTLENNTIDALESFALQGVHGVGVLGVHRNRIHVLEEHALADTAGHVRKVRFVHNWFSCDCQLRLVAEKFFSMVPNLLSDNLCLSPDHHKHKNVSSVYAEVMAACSSRATPRVDQSQEEKLEEESVHVHIAKVDLTTQIIDIQQPTTAEEEQQFQIVTSEEPDIIPSAEPGSSGHGTIEWTCNILLIGLMLVLSVS